MKTSCTAGTYIYRMVYFRTRRYGVYLEMALWIGPFKTEKFLGASSGDFEMFETRSESFSLDLLGTKRKSVSTGIVNLRN